MGKSRLKYGPTFIDFDAQNPGWGMERDSYYQADHHGHTLFWDKDKRQLCDAKGNITNWDKSKEQLYSSDKQLIYGETQTPPARVVDFNHLAKQAWTQDKKSIKRFFLTACVRKQDRHLIEIPKNLLPAEIQFIKNKILNINKILQSPAENIESLASLKLEVTKLFNIEYWIGIALDLIDIDTLNSLIQWQGIWHQFGPGPIEFQTVSEKTPLIWSVGENTQFSFHTTGKTLHEIIFATVHVEQASEFSGVTLYHFRSKTNTDSFYYSPSTLLRENYLLNNEYPSYVTAAYALGPLYYEDFLVASYFGVRLVQSYLPGAINSYFGHRKFFGPGLMSGHDDVHTFAYAYPLADLNENNFKMFMRVYAIIANVLVVLGPEHDALANQLIDTPVAFRDAFLVWLFVERAQHFYTKKPGKEHQFFRALFAEFAHIAGVEVEILECKITGEIVLSTVPIQYRISGNFGGESLIFEGLWNRNINDDPFTPDGMYGVLSMHLKTIEKLAEKKAHSHYVQEPIINALQLTQSNTAKTKPAPTAQLVQASQLPQINA